MERSNFFPYKHYIQHTLISLTKTCITHSSQSSPKKVKDVITILTIFLTSFTCVAKSPDWITTPPTSSHTLFSIGQGETREQAREIALKNLVGQLYTEISANYEQSDSIINKVYTQHIKQSINSSIEQIPISGYQELENHQEGKAFYSLISISKKAFGQSLTREIKLNHQSANQIIESRATAGTELEWWFLKKSELIEYQKNNYRLISALELLIPDVTNQWESFKSLQTNITKFSERNCLLVTPITSEELKHALREQVIISGLIADNIKCRYKLHAQREQKVQELFGRYTASLTLKLILHEDGQAKATEKLAETGVSVSSEKAALYAANQRVLTKLRKSNGATLRKLLTN